jgi:hypothetical protein
MKSILLLFTAAFLASTAFAAQTTSLKTEVVERDIVFIYAAGPDGHVDKSHPLGSGFFLSVPKSSDGTVYAFLATARHVVDPQWAQCGTPNPQKVFYRINKRSFDPKQDTEGVGYIELPLVSGTSHTFLVNPNDDADVALIQLPPTAFNLNEYDVLFWGVNEFASNEELKLLGVGDMVASAGLLPGVSGRNRNFPLFRFGYVAALPKEDIEVPCVPGGPTRHLRLWLINANLSPGASGSPIIYIPPLSGATSRTTITRGVLVGIQSMSISLAGVSGVTPISFAFEIFQNMHLPDANLYRGAIPEPRPLNP